MYRFSSSVLNSLSCTIFMLSGMEIQTAFQYGLDAVRHGFSKYCFFVTIFTNHSSSKLSETFIPVLSSAADHVFAFTYDTVLHNISKCEK